MRPPLHARWAAATGLLALVLVLGGCRPTPPPPDAAAPPRAPWFEEVSASLGVRFTHFAPTAYAMPASLGSGSVLLDYDQDGRLDLLLLQNGGPGSGHRNALFHQEADGRFRDASPGSGLDVEGWFMGGVAGDVNNDGLPDVLATEHGAVRLFLNRGAGRFLEVAATAGLVNPQWAAPASFVDYDRDGWLDIVVGNYLDYDPTMACRDAHGQPDFCGPKSFGDAPVRLWHNRTREPGATPRFEETTATAGLAGHPGAALGLVCADFTGDGWPDLFCSDDGRPNRLFVNRHDGTFREEALQRGLALNTMGATAANMGTAFADLNGDGLPDLLITHLSEEFHSVFLQGPRGFFSDQVAAAGLQQQAWRGTGFGIVAADFNCDGFPDAAWANGLVRRAVPGQTPVAAGVDPWWGRYAQRAQLFAGEAGGRLRDVSDANPALCAAAVVGRSLAVGDLDGDGGPDLVLSGIGGPVQIHHNVAPHRGHWIALSLRDPSAGHRDMIGAQAVVRSGSRQWWTLLQPAQSYLCSHSPVLHVGLGAVDHVDAIDVLWPSGVPERFSPAGVDRLHRLEAGSGRRIEP